MKARIIGTINLKTKKEYYGIAFQIQKGSQYCKYIQSMVTIETMDEAKIRLTEVQKKLNNLTADQIAFIKDQPVNKHQYIKL